MIETATLNQLIFDAFTGKITWLQASRLYPVDDFIGAFYQTRAGMRRQLDGLNDAQAHFFNDKVALWSLSETITHLIYSQNFYYNSLLEITSSQRPHIIEAARGFGEGAHQDIPAETLRIRLDDATMLITEAINQTRLNYDPLKVSRNMLFGEVTYATWILLLLAHEVDHIRQAIAMRRTARAALSETQTVAAVTTAAAGETAPAIIVSATAPKADEKPEETPTIPESGH